LFFLLASACFSCHDDTARDSHPVAIVYQSSATLKPVSMVPKDLLVDGRVECESCHFTHAADTGNPFRLRRATTTELCRGCHDIEGR